MASMLDSIASNMPVASAKRKKQAQATADFQLQQAMASAPAGQPIAPAAIQQVGAQSAANIGTQAVESAKQGLAVAGQVGEQAMQQQQTGLQERVGQLRQGVAATELAGEKEFAELDSDAKRELFDTRMQFERDKMGREFMTERQLQDYMITHAKDAEQFKNYAADSERLSARKTQALQTALTRISQTLEFQNKAGNQKLDNDQVLRLRKAEQELKKQIAAEEAEAAYRRGQFTTGTTIVGTVVGGVLGGPAGAAVGGSAGGAVGGLAYDSQN